MKRVFLGLGTNLGDREKNLEQALDKIAEVIGIIVFRSSVYETEPWGFQSSDQFLNMVIGVDTNLKPSGFTQNCRPMPCLFPTARTAWRHSRSWRDCGLRRPNCSTSTPAGPRVRAILRSQRVLLRAGLLQCKLAVTSKSHRWALRALTQALALGPKGNT